jgi:alpha-tubulin suppressor-like RCC1 family protein
MKTTAKLAAMVTVLAAAALGCAGEVTVEQASRQIIRISGAGAANCALRADGTVTCWGEPFGVWPLEIAEIEGAVELSVGGFSACARLGDGSVACWAIGHQDGYAQPAPVPGLVDATQISVGAGHACAVRRDGTAVCWGRNFDGALGDGTLDDSDAPVAVVGLQGVTQIAAGEFSTCARVGGGVRCWGRALSGQLGDGEEAPVCSENETCRTTPVAVVGLEQVAEIAAGLNGACARRDDGSVVAWGWNSVGEVGDGSNDDRAEPTPVPGMAPVTRIYAGYLRKCAIRTDGTLACWGEGVSATDTVNETFTPTTVPGLRDVVDVTGGWYHLCALDGGGQVSCWGDDAWHQLGDGKKVGHDKPTPVPGL